MTTHARRIAAGLAVFALLAACGTQPGADGHTAESADVATPGADPHQQSGGMPIEDAEPAEAPDDPDDAEASAPEVVAAPEMQVSTPGFDGRTITLGVMRADPDSPDAVSSGATIAGIEAYLARLDAEGGVAGKHPVEIVEIDLADDVDAIRDAYRSAQDDLVLVAHVPSRATEPLLDAFESDDVVGASAALDARWLKEQNTLAFATPHEMQVAHGIDWFRGKARHERIEPGDDADEPRSSLPGSQSAAGVLLPETLMPEAPPLPEPVVCGLVAGERADAEDSGSVEALRVVAAERPVSLGVVASVLGDDTDEPGDADPGDDSADHVASLIESDCEAVVVDAPPATVAPTLRAAEASGFAPRWILLSSSWSPQIARAMPDQIDDEHLVVVGNGLADWGPDAESTAVVAELRTARDRYAPEVADGDLDFAFGYAQATVIHQVLEQATAMGDMSRGGIINAINSLAEVELDGLADDVVYGHPDNRRTPRRSAIFTADPAAPWGLRLIDGPRASASTSTVARELGLR